MSNQSLRTVAERAVAAGRIAARTVGTGAKGATELGSNAVARVKYLKNKAVADPTTTRRAMSAWPPFAGAGIRVASIGSDWRYARVELKANKLNTNYVGVHFGGSLFAMTDPFWMILIMRVIGMDYIVWDKAAEIEFVSPGRGTVHAEFVLREEDVEALRAEADANGKTLKWFETEVIDASGKVVARVRKQIYVRRKRHENDGH